MLGPDFKPLAAPLLGKAAGKSAPVAPAPASDDDWDCRGFEKPLKGGVQMIHGGQVSFLQQKDVNDAQSWANMMSQKQYEEAARKQKQLLKAIAACLLVMLVELAGGIYAHSLALLSDSAHMLADIASYCIALVAVGVTLPLEASSGKETIQQKLKQQASYGLHRVEVLGGLGSILVVWFTAGGLLYEGISRLVAQLNPAIHVPEINGTAMVLVAAFGLVFNAAILYVFRDVAHSHGGHDHGNDHGHSHGAEDVTARAAIVHAMGDIAQSIGMLVTASLITLNGQRWSVLDPLVTIVCSLYMLYGTLSLLKEVFLVLIEATPHSVDAHAVRDALRKRSDVLAIKCFHVWALAPGKVMLTACVQTTEECDDTDDVLRDLQNVCRYKFGIHHATFQVTREASLMG
jgi:zinc transporter 2